MNNNPKESNLYNPVNLDTDICIFCANPTEPKLDKKGRPYVHCNFCNSMTFLRAEQSRIGYEVLAKIIKKNAAQHQALIKSQYRKMLDEKTPLIQKIIPKYP